MNTAQVTATDARGRNDAKTRAHSMGAPAADPRCHWRWMGWNDVALGKGFSREYDALPAHDQHNYESGRAFAAAIMGTGRPLPRWPRNRKFSTILRGSPDAAYEALRNEAVHQSPQRERGTA